MALQKDKIVKGITLSYWRIGTINNNRVAGNTNGTINGYISKASRDESAQNFHIREPFTIEGVDLTIEQIYTGIKESKMVEIIKEDMTTEMVETNWFADATDVLEGE